MSAKTQARTRYLVESALMLALATVLNEYTKFIPMPLGGGVTICSMLPLVLISFRFGWKRGVATAFVFSLLQLIFGLDNVAYSTSVSMTLGIVVLDYLVPYSVIGLAALVPGKRLEGRYVGGIVLTFALRLACHFITGWWIWDALWPNDFGLVAPIYSIAYNGSYMLGEMILTSVVALLLLKTPLNRFMAGEDVK